MVDTLYLISKTESGWVMVTGMWEKRAKRWDVS